MVDGGLSDAAAGEALKSLLLSPFRPAALRNPSTSDLRFQLRPAFANPARYEQRHPG